METSPSFFFELSIIDYTVIAILVGLNLFIGLKAKTSQSTSSETNSTHQLKSHLMMTRGLTLPLFVATLGATWYGGIFGVAEIAFESGLYNLLTQGVFWYISYFIFAFFVLEKLQSGDYFNLPDFFKVHVGKKMQKLSSVLNLLALMPLVYIIGLSSLFELFLPLQKWQALVLSSFFVGLYTYKGGLKSIVYTDVYQFSIMMISMIGLALYSMISFGFSPLERLPETHYDLTGGFGILETLSWGFIALSTLVSPNFYHRTFAAQNKQTAKKGILWCIFFWFIFDVSLTLSAMYAKSMLIHADKSVGLFAYALKVLPSGMKGLFLAGLVATILSSLDSNIFLSSSTIIKGLFEAKEHNFKRAHHLSVISIILITGLLALITNASVKELWRLLGTLSASTLLIPLMLVVFFQKTKWTDRELFFPALMTTLSLLLWHYFDLHVKIIDGLYFGIIFNALLVMIFKFTFVKKNSL